MIYTLLSLGLLALGLTSLYRDHSHERGALAGGLSYLVGAITVMLWPTKHSAIFDAATHAPGLGRLVNDMCATLSVMLQFIFITSLSKAWYRWRRIAVVVYVALLVGFVELWFPIYGAPGHALARDLYAGYASGPLLVRVWNTIVGLTIPYTCVLAFIGFNQANGRIHNRYPRFTTAAGTTTYGLATVYGSLVVAQLGAAWLGRGDIGIKRFLGPIVVLCLVLILVDTGFVLFGPRILRRLQRGCAYIRQWFSLTEKQAQINRGIERLEQLLVDNTNAAGVASDQRVHLDKYADAAVIDAVDVHLKAHGIAAYERKAGRQAVRYLVLNRANAVRPLYDDERPVGEDEDDSGLAGLDDEGLLVDLSRREQEHLYVHADAARIAGLIILMQRGEMLVSGRLTELEPRQEAEGWRREAAALIVEVLRAHARDKKPTLFVVERRKMTRTSFVADRRKVTRKTPKAMEGGRMKGKGSLHDFNPRNTGLYEARVWKAYYDRDWPLVLLLVYRLLRSQFKLGPLQGALATYRSVRAAVAWKPRDNDPEKVRALLRQFYAVLRTATGAPFDANAAGDAELEYWVIHRRLDGEKGRPELIDAITGIAVEVYGLSVAQARAAGAARARAADLVDDITSGRQEPTPKAWATVAAELRRAYTLLRDAAASNTHHERATA